MGQLYLFIFHNIAQCSYSTAYYRLGHIYITDDLLKFQMAEFMTTSIVKKDSDCQFYTFKLCGNDTDNYLPYVLLALQVRICINCFFKREDLVDDRTRRLWASLQEPVH